MNNILQFLLLIFLTLAISPWANGQVPVGDKNKTITISNGVIRKEFILSSKRPGTIIVGAIFDKRNNRELLTDHNPFPWFEFVINHGLVTSNDPLWEYIDSSQRTMRNKGTEYTLNFKGASGPVKGLYISIKEQLFPGSTLIREQLILHVKGRTEFELDKDKNKLHFIFPQYTYRTMQSGVKSTEIRIAAWDGEVLDSVNNSSDDTRKDNGSDLNLSQAHMFHPKTIKRLLHAGDHLSFKGPFGFISDGDYTFMMAYEHASQDSLLPGGIRPAPDSMRTLKALSFLQIEQEIGDKSMSSAVEIVRGGYLDGEKISIDKPYKSVWTATGFYSAKEKDEPGKLLHNYLLKWITSFPQTRETRFYYNTWGMQRNEADQGKDLRGVLNYERIFQEIRYAHQMGIEIFVLDDGWEDMMGVWKPNKRLGKGLKPIRDTLKKYGMTLGVWMSPLAIDPRTARYKQHPGWVIRDDQRLPVEGQGNVPVFDFVSGFSDLFIQDCKWLIDQGVSFFKWDALGIYYPYRTKGFHGNEQINSKEDVIARYGYLFPLYIKKAMTALMTYNPDVVVEIDLTENVRALMGLSTMSVGKLFFMNNGASVYGDYSQYRAKSMRTVANEYAGIVPLQLFTYANYPQDAPPFMSQRYNVNSSIIAGRGLWGNLSLMSSEQRSRVGKLVNKAKRVSPFLKNTPTSVIGKVGASPEIYTQVNLTKAAGQVIAFSGSAMHYTHKVVLNSKGFLGVIDNAFALMGDTLYLYFQFPMPDASREAFILPNQSTGIKIVSCTSWLDAVHLNENKLSIACGAPGEIVIEWPGTAGYPKIAGDQLKTTVRTRGNNYQVEIHVQGFNTQILIE